jgi:peptide/nickel transport system substrate-binding protein
MSRWPLSLVAPLLLVGCAPAASTAPAAGGVTPAAVRDEQQILRLAVGQLTGTLSPQAPASSVELYWNLYDNLTQFGPNFEVRPLADRWELRDQNRTWRFTLKRSVTWPDGKPLTAQDVAFNEMLKSNWPARSYFTFATGATAIDDWTVDILSSQPAMSVPNGATRL